MITSIKLMGMVRRNAAIAMATVLEADGFSKEVICMGVMFEAAEVERLYREIGVVQGGGTFERKVDVASPFALNNGLEN